MSLLAAIIHGVGIAAVAIIIGTIITGRWPWQTK